MVKNCHRDIKTEHSKLISNKGKNNNNNSKSIDNNLAYLNNKTKKFLKVLIQLEIIFEY